MSNQSNNSGCEYCCTPNECTKKKCSNKQCRNKTCQLMGNCLTCRLRKTETKESRCPDCGNFKQCRKVSCLICRSADVCEILGTCRQCRIAPRELRRSRDSNKNASYTQYFIY